MVTTAAFGIYRSREDAKRAVEQLEHDGFRRLDVRVLFPDNEQTREFVRENQTIPPEGTASGRTANEDLDGSLGLTEPARGPVRGALPEALRDMGIPEDEAQEIGNRVKDGGILVSVSCDRVGDTERARAALQQTGAEFTASTEKGR